MVLNRHSFNIETYKAKKLLGEGSFGKIYWAYDINTKEEYAVKLVCIYLITIIYI